MICKRWGCGQPAGGQRAGAARRRSTPRSSHAGGGGSGCGPHDCPTRASSKGAAWTLAFSRSPAGPPARAPATGPLGTGGLQSEPAGGKRSDTAAVHDTKRGGDGMRDEKHSSFKTRAQRVGKSRCTRNKSWPWRQRPGSPSSRQSDHSLPGEPGGGGGLGEGGSPGSSRPGVAKAHQGQAQLGAQG